MIHSRLSSSILHRALHSCNCNVRHIVRKTSPLLLLTFATTPLLTPHHGDADHPEKFMEKFGDLLANKFDGRPLLWTIIGVNAAVFVAWHINPDWMARHFLLSVENVQSGRSLCSLLATIGANRIGERAWADFTPS